MLFRLFPEDQRITDAGWNQGTMAGIARALGHGQTGAGPATELDRGLGVNIGGMLIRMVFTLLLHPGSLRIGEGEFKAVNQVS